MCQWLPAWILKEQETAAAIRTFASVFHHVYLWQVVRTNDLVMLGSEGPLRYTPHEIDARSLELTKDYVVPDAVKRDMEHAGIGFGDFFGIKLIKDDMGIRELMARDDIPIFTDDRPKLEFYVTRNLLMKKRRHP